MCALIFVILGRKTQRCRETVDLCGNLFTSSDHVEDQEIDSDKVVPSSYLTWFVSRLTSFMIIRTTILRLSLNGGPQNHG